MSDSRHSTKTGVTVFTWGSQDNSPLKHQYLYETANHFYQTQFFSRNPGHAAILLTLPDNIANRAQVESELAGTNIPYQFKKYQTNKINYKTPHSLNQNTESDIPAFAASVIEVYFSFWPSHEAAASFSTYEADLKDERRGIPVTFNQKSMHELNPQLKPEVSPRKKRPMSRFFTEEKDEITLGFHSYYHPIHNKPELNKLMSIYQQKQLDAEKINSIKIISNKLQALKDLMSKNKAPSQPIFMPALLESQITQYIDEHACQEIKPFIKSKGLVTVDELEKINSILLDEKNKLKMNKKWAVLEFIHSLYDYAATTALTPEQKKIAKEVVYLRTLLFYANNATNLKKVNKYIKKYNLWMTTPSKKITTLTTNDEIKSSLIPYLEDKLDDINPRSLLNQNIQIKISDLLYPNDDIDASIEDVKSEHKRVREFVTVIINIKYLLTNQIDGSTDKKLTRCICAMEQLHLNDLFEESKEDFEIFILALKKCIPKGIYNKKINQDFIPGALKATLVFSEYFLQNMIDKAISFDDSIINILTNQSYLVGKQPDHTVSVPLLTEKREGMDAIAMLKEMAAIAKEKKPFDLFYYNCSHTCAQILKSSTGNKNWIFNQGELGVVFTPHLIYMRTREYLDALNNPLYQTPNNCFFQYQRCLSYLGNRATSKFQEVEVETSPIKRTLSRVDAIISTTTATGLEILGASTFTAQKFLFSPAQKIGVKRKLEFGSDNEEAKVKRRRVEKKSS